VIDLYTAGTGNGHRAALALEESGLAYRAHKLNLAAGDQRKPEYLAINPAGTIPALVDHEGPGGKPLAIAQSGAIALYVAEKSGRLLPKDPARRATALHWLMFACTDCAMTGGTIFQLANNAPEKSPSSVKFLEDRLIGFFRVCDQRLAGREFLADEFSVADLALFPVANMRKAMIEAAGGMPNLLAWITRIGARPAIAKGMTVSA
jgi:GSH-dependent disulfide-bond oxidoreductase